MRHAWPEGCTQHAYHMVDCQCGEVSYIGDLFWVAEGQGATWAIIILSFFYPLTCSSAGQSQVEYLIELTFRDKISTWGVLVTETGGKWSNSWTEDCRNQIVVSMGLIFPQRIQVIRESVVDHNFISWSYSIVDHLKSFRDTYRCKQLNEGPSPMLECAILQTWPPERNPSSPFLNRNFVLQKKSCLGRWSRIMAAASRN
jgi:hypothetical protein